MIRMIFPIAVSAVASATFAAVLTQEPGQGTTQMQAPAKDTFIWQSRNSNLKDLSTEFGQLYGTLLDAMKQGIGIETYLYQGGTTRSLESIMRAERLVAGEYFPKEADLFVCQLNPSICKIVTKGSERSAKWTNGPADEMRLPKLTFEPVIVHREYPKKAEQRLGSIVVDERGGCEQYDGDCRKYVRNLNRVPMEELEGRYEGPVLVPTLAYRTRITFTNLPAAASSPAPVPVASAVQKVLQKRPNMTRSIVPDVNFMMQGDGTDASAEGSRQRIFELISHPFARKADIPSGRMLIGVFDTWLDAMHCDIASAVTSYIDPGEKPLGVESGKPCGTRGNSSEPFDHGTHVVGLLAGRPDSKSGPGMNPNARIYFVRINPQQMKSDDSVYLNHVAERLNAIYKDDRVDVVNLSFQYPFPEGLNDTFLSAIAHQYRVTLFVAAAGNYNQELSAGGVCTVRPACAGKANLITVASLDLSSNKPVLDSSNYGSAVHIAAPGKNVMSSISGGRMGLMSGTSQAAPLVAGAASLLLLQNPKLYPEAVKNRLVYTSDLFPSLYKQVLGGRLNVSRALAFEFAQLSLTTGQSLQGQVVNLASSIALFDTETGKKLNPIWSQIRRLKYDKQANSYTMFWKPGNDEPLKRSFVAPQNSKQVLQLKSEQSTPALKTYTLGQIDDYVAAIPQDSQ
jgi:hypothetical protein